MSKTFSRFWLETNEDQGRVAGLIFDNGTTSDENFLRWGKTGRRGGFGVVEGEHSDELWMVDVETRKVVPRPPQPQVIRKEHIQAERDRRLASGFEYDFGHSRGMHRIGLSDADMRGWDRVTTWATIQAVTGTHGDWMFVTTDTGEVAVTPAEWLQIMNAATSYTDPIWQASFALEAMDPLPADYADDHYWRPR